MARGKKTPVTETRICSRCNKEKDLLCFVGGRTKCKQCKNEETSERYYSNPDVMERKKALEKVKYHLHQDEKIAYAKKYLSANKERVNARKRVTYRKQGRNQWLKKNYGITSEEYEKILAKQNGRCAICETDIPNGLHKIWNVDHDHKSGKVRGLLCWNCNSAIGLLKDDDKVIENALRYVRLLPPK
jgi:hypothetical protein